MLTSLIDCLTCVLHPFWDQPPSAQFRMVHPCWSTFRWDEEWRCCWREAQSSPDGPPGIYCHNFKMSFNQPVVMRVYACFFNRLSYFCRTLVVQKNLGVHFCENVFTFFANHFFCSFCLYSRIPNLNVLVRYLRASPCQFHSRSRSERKFMNWYNESDQGSIKKKYKNWQNTGQIVKQ